ncbi:MAG TPA: D-glycero-beta-D-manno-heptose 1-phosphate adenylyltransferase [Candidatus Sulfotelmatobacter sp.]|nr:D-glycero-beta-D-manno-heptose 1-phosphate adenylyltransferase [Candidatus Sulfotelmatobacter sp.]
MSELVVVVGDTLLDQDLHGSVQRLAADCPVPIVEEPTEHARAGGAGLAATLAAREGIRVALLTALAADEGGELLRELLLTAGVEVIDVGLSGGTPRKVRVHGRGHALVRIDWNGDRRAPAGDPSREALAVLEAADAVLVSDYGGGVPCSQPLREQLERRADDIPIAWDPHPHGAPPVTGVLLATPSEAEAAHLCERPREEATPALIEQGRVLARQWRARSIAITRGDRGALLVTGDGRAVAVPAPRIAAGDACGAGDCFAAAATVALAAGSSVDRAVSAAVKEASHFVSTGGAASRSQQRSGGAGLRTLQPGGVRSLQDSDHAFPRDAFGLAAAVRQRGGTVVATGGCFDLLHAGHVSVLRSARALGDCLIVCLNSDASVRRLKGEGRPVVAQADRTVVLESLSWVDGVVVFEEDTPETVLAQLQPDIWAKGGDYSVEELPEAALVRSWGGTVVTLPYLEGRSTSRLLEQVSRRGE